MCQMQEEVDEWELLGEHGSGVHQMPHQRLSSQTGEENIPTNTLIIVCLHILNEILFLCIFCFHFNVLLILFSVMYYLFCLKYKNIFGSIFT